MRQLKGAEKTQRGLPERTMAEMDARRIVNSLGELLIGGTKALFGMARAICYREGTMECRIEVDTTEMMKVRGKRPARLSSTC